jgi:hypothetical protein
MNMRLFGIVSAIAVLGMVGSCKKDTSPPKDLSEAGHPRILLLEGEEQQIHDLIEADETWEKMHFAIIEKSNDLLGKEPLERIMVGRRLLGTSRELLKRVFYLSYAYRMTGNEKFLKKAEEELLAVSWFSDWNPSHFLDVAEMTMGVAIGYDWLFEDLSDINREVIKSAILMKGINPSKNSSYTWWLNSSNNWNQVCNAGMVYGALAIQEDYPDLAEEIIDRAFQSIPISMEAYQPDGVYPEGYGYWGYGTTFNMLFLSAIEKALGTDKGLAATPGFLETGNFLKHMLTPTGKSFNWADCGTGTNLNTAMFWIAERTNDPSVLWSEKKFLETSNFSKFNGIRSLPALMIWAKDIPLSNITEPEDKFFMGQGANPVAIMRSSWTDPLAVYLGFKAGSPSVNHGHMDIGSFVMEEQNRRWATDLGMQNYESLESLGMSIFGKTQDAERWTIFRMNTYSHNVLIIDDQQQRVDGYAKIDKYSDNEDFMFAVSDISTVYSGQLKKATRGVGIKDGKYTIIRDEIETLDKTTMVRWNMVTFSSVVLGDKEATLTDDGKTLYLKVLGPDNIEMKTWSTAPPNNYDAANPGTIMVGFECEVPANTSQAIEVILVPKPVETEAEFLNITLEEW